MATSPASALLPSPLPHPFLLFPARRAAFGVRPLSQPLGAGRPRLQAPPPPPTPVEEAADEQDATPPLRLLEPPPEEDPFPSEVYLSLSYSWNFVPRCWKVTRMLWFCCWKCWLWTHFSPGADICFLLSHYADGARRPWFLQDRLRADDEGVRDWVSGRARRDGCICFPGRGATPQS